MASSQLFQLLATSLVEITFVWRISSSTWFFHHSFHFRYPFEFFHCYVRVVFDHVFHFFFYHSAQPLSQLLNLFFFFLLIFQIFLLNFNLSYWCLLSQPPPGGQSISDFLFDCDPRLSVIGSLAFRRTYLVTLGRSSSAWTQCPRSSGAGNRYLTVSTVGSKTPCLHVRRLTRTSCMKGGKLGASPSRQLLFKASAQRAANGQHSLPTSACLSSRRICVLKLFTATSTRPFARGSSPGVRVSTMPRELAHFRKTPENSWPRSECILPMWKPSILSLRMKSIAVLVTSLAVLVIIGAARRKILMSKPPGLSSSSPSFFSGGGKR